MKHVDKTEIIVGMVVVFSTTMVSEFVKYFLEQSKYNLLISVSFFVVALIIIIAFDKISDRRISNGKNAQSIAIRSSKFISDYYKHVKAISKSGTWESEEKDIVDTFHSISRHLLLIGEYKVRYLIGKIIFNKTKSKIIQMQMQIDEMGWTSVLMGKKNSVALIENAIAMSSIVVKKTHDEYKATIVNPDDEQMFMAYLAARGMRHIASTLFKTIEERIELSLKALAIIDSLEKMKKILPQACNKEKLDEMKAGIQYGLGVAYLSAYNQKKGQHPSTYLTYIEKAFYYNDLSMKFAITLENKHRYIKCLLIENEIFNSIHVKKIVPIEVIQSEATKNEVISSILSINASDYTNNLDLVEKILNSSIYIDEAYEIFLEEKIRPEVLVNET